MLPFVNTVARSFSAEGPISRNEVYLWPVRFTLDAYARLVQGGAFWRAYRNSAYITVVGTSIQMLLSTMAAYPLSRRDLPGRGILMSLIIFQLVFPPGLIPFYLNVRQLGLIDTYWSVILPYALNTFNMIVLKSYFQALPVELEESAVIDGANDFQVLRHIMLPLAAPVMGTLALFYSVANWNMFLPAIFFLNDGSKHPLQVILREMIWSLLLMEEAAGPEEFETAAGIEALKAGSVIVATVPMLVAYAFLQRYFVKGITLGSIKG
jgi:putative aldouronate transport system permease protein